MSDRRTTLLDAAVREIATHGTRGMRVERVAKLAGVSPALIYHHFADRSSLLQAALIHIGELADTYTAPPDDRPSGRERLLAVVSAEIQDDESVRHNSTAWSELRNSAIFDDELRDTFSTLTARWVEDLAELVREGQHDGTIDPSLDPINLGTQLSSLVEGISGRWLCQQLDTGAARQLLIAAAETLLGGTHRPPTQTTATKRRRAAAE
jgi:AcrR family transcriptional regulator